MFQNCVDCFSKDMWGSSRAIYLFEKSFTCVLFRVEGFTNEMGWDVAEPTCVLKLALSSSSAVPIVSWTNRTGWRGQFRDVVTPGMCCLFCRKASRLFLIWDSTGAISRCRQNACIACCGLTVFLGVEHFRLWVSSVFVHEMRKDLIGAISVFQNCIVSF